MQHNHRKIIIFNGPPGCGKDTGSEAVRSFVQIHAAYLKPTHMKFAEPLKKGIHDLYCAFHPWDYYDSNEGRKDKDKPCGDFFGLTPREIYIQAFEFLEMLHGGEALGYIMRKRIVRNSFNSVVVISDAGRMGDLEPIIDLVGEHNILIVEVYPSPAIEWDNRKHIGDEVKAKFPHAHVTKIPNKIGDRSDRDIFRMLCQGVAKNFLKIEEREDV